LRQRGLLDLSEVVLRVAVELEDIDLDQGIVFVRPDFRQIEPVVPVLADVAFRHDLHREFPFRKIAAFDRFI
jgi:hypothetical protein